MAAMFKKSKRNFRKKNVAEDDEQGETEPQVDCEPIKVPIEIPFITDKPKIKKTAKVKTVSSASSLLSFDDDLTADDGQEFKVKKSKESRKLAKKLDQDRKKKDVKEKLPAKIEEKAGDANSDNENAADPVDDDKIAALRAELSKMSRTEDDEEDEDEDLSKRPGNEGISTSDGHVFNIPDAAAIHAARKKREMARQLGTGQDFVPLDDTDRYGGRFGNTSVNSRLVREDGDGAGEVCGPGRRDTG